MNPEIDDLIKQLYAGNLSIQELEGHKDDLTKDFQVVTSCRVYVLQNSNQKIVGYYKEEKSGQFAGTIMNQLTYNFAKILGLDNCIVPSGKIESFSHNEKIYKGGTVQPSQEGITLYQYQYHPELRKSSILLNEYIEAIFSSVILGMFDAHNHNILIDSNSGIHFFDLARSLPHANTYLDRGDYLSYPYRCSLLYEKESAAILSMRIRKELQERLYLLKDRLGDIKLFLKANETKELINNLPKYWFSTAHIYAALKNRIENLENAFQNHSIQQVRDLVFNAFPHYRFICLLNFCMLLDWRAQVNDSFLLNRCINNIDKPILYQFIPIPIEGMIDECIKLGLDPTMILECSKKETLTQSISCIVHHVQDKHKYPENPVEMNILKQQGERLKKELKNVAALDYKDWASDHTEEDFFNS